MHFTLRYVYTLRLIGPISYLGACYIHAKVTKCIREKISLYFYGWTIKSHSPGYEIGRLIAVCKRSFTRPDVSWRINNTSTKGKGALWMEKEKIRVNKKNKLISKLRTWSNRSLCSLSKLWTACQNHRITLWLGWKPWRKWMGEIITTDLHCFAENTKHKHVLKNLFLFLLFIHILI